jgi:hypothetical protein
MSLIFGQMIDGCRDRDSDGGPPVHKVVEKITGVLFRAKDATAELRPKRADRDLVKFLLRSGGRLTDSLEFEFFEHLLAERRNLVN